MKHQSFRKRTKMKKTFIAIAAAVVLASSSAGAATAAESPYENAADVDLEQMASNILAASLCKGTLFNGESVVPHLVAASIVLGRKRAENAFFSGIRKNYEVPSREWLEFEGGVISALFQPTDSALARQWRSRHENGYHKRD